jgi:hypothetical protein
MKLVSLILFFVLSLGVCEGLQGKEFGNPALQFELGREHGLNSTASLSHDMLQRIQSGAELGNRDNIYFLGLLKMYGISLQLNYKGALAEFRKAANLGLPEAMTAFGMCAYSGVGMAKDDTVAISWYVHVEHMHITSRCEQ